MYGYVLFYEDIWCSNGPLFKLKNKYHYIMALLSVFFLQARYGKIKQGEVSL